MLPFLRKVAESQSIVAVGAILAGTGIAIDAFATHALRARISPESLTVIFTASRYQLYHALALVCLGLLARQSEQPARSRFQVAASLIMLGTLLFSGSLYALALSGISQLGWITPLGGLSFILGWAVTAAAAWTWRGQENRSKKSTPSG